MRGAWGIDCRGLKGTFRGDGNVYILIKVIVTWVCTFGALKKGPFLLHVNYTSIKLTLKV